MRGVLAAGRTFVVKTAVWSNFSTLPQLGFGAQQRTQKRDATAAGKGEQARSIKNLGRRNFWSARVGVIGRDCFGVFDAGLKCK